LFVFKDFQSFKDLDQIPGLSMPGKSDFKTQGLSMTFQDLLQPWSLVQIFMAGMQTWPVFQGNSGKYIS